jgi:hypothetical protein
VAVPDSGCRGVFRPAALPEADMVRVRVGLVRHQFETRPALLA